MAKYFIIGESGSDELWLIDTQSKTAEVITANGVLNQSIDQARRDKTSIIKGISIAVASDSRSGVDAKMTITDPNNSK